MGATKKALKSVNYKQIMSKLFGGNRNNISTSLNNASYDKACDKDCNEHLPGRDGRGRGEEKEPKT